jgi:hypothetical protein
VDKGLDDNLAKDSAVPRPTDPERAWLALGLSQPGGKLPIFDGQGQQVSPAMVRACIEQGWATPWVANPLKPDWLICKLTEAGRAALGA